MDENISVVIPTYNERDNIKEREMSIIMHKLLTYLSTKRFGNTLAISIIAIFLFLSLIRPYPSGKTLDSILNHSGDDWEAYANNALNIKYEGLLMPFIKDAYVSPSSFLYNYFLALFFIIFGDRLMPIVIMQHLMLGFSVALIYWAFRNKMKKLTGLIFLCTLLVFAFLDVYKYYSSRLLSENLLLFTISLFFFCFVKSFDKDNFFLQLSAAALLGVSILIRPNIVLYGIVLIPLVAFYYLKKGRQGMVKFISFCLVLFLSSSFLAIRNYLVCKKWYFLPTLVSSPVAYMLYCNPIPSCVDLSKVNTNLLYTKLHFSEEIVSLLEYALQKPLLFLGYYLKKILFCFGFVTIIAPFYRLRPHWTIMWLGYFTYLIMRVKEYKKFETWEIAVHLYIWSYYAALMTTVIESYGFRMIIAGTNLVLVFSFIALDKILILKWAQRRKDFLCSMVKKIINESCAKQ